jgi:glycosyltransferase involved in cell wall biosynthesis
MRSGEKNTPLRGAPADKRKGLAELIEALSCILEYEPVVLLVAGSGDTKAHRCQVERLGIAHAVLFLGYVSDEELSTLYALCDLFVSSSYYESFGLTLAEAMTAGTSVVARDVGGTAEVVRPGTGILVRESGPRALADAILRALADPSLGADNRAYALGAFSWEQGARALYAILDRLIQEKGGASCRP